MKKLLLLSVALLLVGCNGFSDPSTTASTSKEESTTATSQSITPSQSQSVAPSISTSESSTSTSVSPKSDHYLFVFKNNIDETKAGVDYSETAHQGKLLGYFNKSHNGIVTKVTNTKIFSGNFEETRYITAGSASADGTLTITTYAPAKKIIVNGISFLKKVTYPTTYINNDWASVNVNGVSKLTTKYTSEVPQVEDTLEYEFAESTSTITIKNEEADPTITSHRFYISSLDIYF